MIFNELYMEGFLVFRWNHKREEALKILLRWVVEVRDGQFLRLQYVNSCYFLLYKRLH